MINYPKLTDSLEISAKMFLQCLKITLFLKICVKLSKMKILKGITKSKLKIWETVRSELKQRSGSACAYIAHKMSKSSEKHY